MYLFCIFLFFITAAFFILAVILAHVDGREAKESDVKVNLRRQVVQKEHEV